MPSDTSVTLPPAEADEIQEKLDRGNEHRRNILSALASADSDALNTSQIRERADAPSGSMNHYLTALADWGVIEETGEREYSQGGGRRARVWRLTEKGAAFIEERPDALTTPKGAATAERVTALENRIAALEDETRKRRKAMVEILKVIAEVQDDATQQQVRQIVRDSDL
jgi:predicted transcriptional regulator